MHLKKMGIVRFTKQSVVCLAVSMLVGAHLKPPLFPTEHGSDVPLLYVPKKEAWARSGWWKMKYMNQTGINASAEIPLPKVALCVTGAVRTLPMAEVHRDLQRFVVDRWKTDIFLVMHLDGTTRERHSVGATSAFSLAEVQSAVKELKPRRSVLHDTRRKLHPCGARLDAPHPLNCAPQFQNHDQCHRLVLEAEAEDKRAYSWVLSTRPDLHWEAPLSDLRLFPTSRAWALVYKENQNWDSVHAKDKALLVPRRYLTACLHFPATLDGCAPPGDVAQTRKTICGFEPAGGCECVLARALAAKKVPLGFFFSKASVEKVINWNATEGGGAARYRSPEDPDEDYSGTRGLPMELR